MRRATRTPTRIAQRIAGARTAVALMRSTSRTSRGGDGTDDGIRRTSAHRPCCACGSGSNVASTRTRAAAPARSMLPRDIDANSAAPRRFAYIGSATRSMRRPRMSACIWHHTSEIAPPPRIRSTGIGRLMKRSTESSSQRALNATPSSTARTRCDRSVVMEMLRNAARRVRSSTGLRSPLSHGVKSTPPDPTGARDASAVSRSYLALLDGPVSSPGPIESASHCRQMPAVSWLFATRYEPARSPGTDAI